eukprot:g39231.t1
MVMNFILRSEKKWFVNDGQALGSQEVSYLPQYLQPLTCSFEDIVFICTVIVPHNTMEDVLTVKFGLCLHKDCVAVSFTDTVTDKMPLQLAD